MEAAVGELVHGIGYRRAGAWTQLWASWCMGSAVSELAQTGGCERTCAQTRLQGSWCRVVEGRREGVQEVPWVLWFRCFGQELSKQ
jgi:hypothetical protein